MSKQKQSLFVNSLFSKLESLENRDPRGYYELINAIRSNTFDKCKPGETDSIDPDTWLEHFKNLLGPSKDISEEQVQLENFVKQHKNDLSTELDHPFTRLEVEKAIKLLKNNKATGFDIVSNEMLKQGKRTIICLFGICIKVDLVARHRGLKRSIHG